MKFTIQKNVLNDAIQAVSKAVASRTTIPILAGIKIQAFTSEVVLTASDTDMSIQVSIPLETETATVGTVEKTGSVVLVAKFLVEIIKKLPKEEVHIAVGDGFKTVITSGRSVIDLSGLDPEEFPRLPTIGDKDAVTMPANKLRDMINSTSFAVSTNEGTPILMGVLWNLQEGALKFVATDRHRMATLSTPVETGIEFSNTVISGLNLKELVKVLPDRDEPVEIVVEDNQVLFRSGNILFFSRILDGTFPDTSKIVPSDFKTELRINTKTFGEAIDRAYLLSREEKTNIVRLTSIIDGGIMVSSAASEIGKVEEELSETSLTGEEIKVAFNSKYMLDILKVIDCDELFIGFNGPMSPIIIKPVGVADALHLVLPYRTTS